MKTYAQVGVMQHAVHPARRGHRCMWVFGDSDKTCPLPVRWTLGPLHHGMSRVYCERHGAILYKRIRASSKRTR